MHMTGTKIPKAIKKHVANEDGPTNDRVIGIDEVGRGAWAGPLLVCAARLKKDKKYPSGLTDSKLLSKKQREKLFPQIAAAFDIGEGWVSADMIDELGLSRALKSACLLATFQITDDKAEKIILDGTVNMFVDTGYTNVETIAKADLTIPEVSAAAIYAKVLRDQHMTEHASEHPQYGFEKHVGYGTKKHHEALIKHGVTVLHRKSFKPIQLLV
jgi:ribonuclease HII